MGRRRFIPRCPICRKVMEQLPHEAGEKPLYQCSACGVVIKSTIPSGRKESET